MLPYPTALVLATVSAAGAGIRQAHQDNFFTAMARADLAYNGCRLEKIKSAEKEALYRQGDMCGQRLCVGCWWFAIMCIVVKYIEARWAILLALCSSTAFIAYEWKFGALVLWSHGKSVPKLCTHLLYFEMSYIVFSAAATICFMLIPLTYFNFERPPVLTALKKEFDRLSTSMSDPAKTCYKSDFFKDLCQEALDEAQWGNDGTVGPDEFCAAVGNIVQDETFGNNHWITAALWPYREKRMLKQDALHLMISTCAIHLEKQGCGVEVNYHFYMLQLKPGKRVTADDVEAQYEELKQKYKRWTETSPSGRRRLQSEVDSLMSSYQAVQAYLLAG